MIPSARRAAPLPLLPAALLLLAGCGGGDALDLRFRPAPGTRFRSEMVVDQRILAPVEGTEQAMDQTLGFELTTEVLAPPPGGGHRARLTFDRTRMRMRNPAGEVAFDSAHPAEPIPAQFRGLAFMAGRSLECAFAADGTVDRVSGMDALFDGMMEEMAVPAGERREVLAAGIKRQFGDGAMREMVGSLVTGFAGRPVRVGESWEWRRRLQAILPMTLDWTSTLLSREGGRARVALRGRVSPFEEAPPVDLGLARMRSSFTGTVEGEVEVEEATGFPASLRTVQEIAGTLTLEMDGVPPAVNPMRVSSTTTVKRLP